MPGFNSWNPIDPGDTSNFPDSFASTPPTPPSEQELAQLHENHELPGDTHSSSLPSSSFGWEGDLQSIVLRQSSLLQRQQEETPQGFNDMLAMIEKMTGGQSEEPEQDPFSSDFMKFMRGDTEEE